MVPHRRIKALSDRQLRALTRARLLAYRRKVLSLENSPEESDYSGAEVAALDPSYIWFKSDPRWKPHYDSVLNALARLQK